MYYKLKGTKLDKIALAVRFVNVLCYVSDGHRQGSGEKLEFARGGGGVVAEIVMLIKGEGGRDQDSLKNSE